MQVVVPATNVGDGVLDAIAGAGYAPQVVDVSGSDDAYWHLLHELWGAAADFVIVEQDIIVRADTLDAIGECQRPWCAARYAYLGSPDYAGLGCARFRATLMHAFPDVIDEIAGFSDELHPRRHWCTLDFVLQQALKKRGVKQCVHARVGHLSDTVSHGCC